MQHRMENHNGGPPPEAVESSNRRRLITLDRMEAEYSIPRSTAYELIAAGRISAVKLGRRTLIEVQSVDTMIAALPRIERASNSGQPHVEALADGSFGAGCAKIKEVSATVVGQLAAM